MKDSVVQLIRRFNPASQLGNWEFLRPAPSGRPQGWHEIEGAYRVLILAAPGAGKTFEALTCARKFQKRGRKAFFIRIESIGSDFEQAFEVGTAEEFAAWQSSNEEAWFFLDSVDEAQLETPRALENAIRIFGERTYSALERAHIFITSREDAWQALSDRTLIKQYIPHSTMQSGSDTEDDALESIGKTQDDGLQAFRMAGLSLNEIQLFAAHYGVSDIGKFVTAIDHGNLSSFAERPFDIKALIRKWQADGRLGSRFEVLTRMVELQLSPLTSGIATPRITMEKAQTGIRNLAAAAMLTGKTIIRLPTGILSPERIDPVQVLPDWAPEDVDTLLRTGIFDDVVYNSVRFRHREIRELLTAQWANDQLQHTGARPDVEGLFFRTIYGGTVIIPRLRPALAWLILFDETIRDKALALDPTIATEGGDPSHLPLPVRQFMLAAIVGRMAARSE